MQEVKLLDQWFGIGIWGVVALSVIVGVTPVGAETTTTTTTVTHPDGTTTTTVEETNTEPEPPPQNQRNLVGPAGATGVIRRSDRRQGRRDGDPRLD